MPPPIENLTSAFAEVIVMLFLQGSQAVARRLAFSPDGSLLASVAENGRIVSIWDALTGQHHTDVAGHSDVITCLAFDPVGGLLASADRRGNVRLWHAAGLARIDPPIALNHFVTCLTFSPDGTRLAVGGCPGHRSRYGIHLLEMKAITTERAALQGDQQVAYCVAFSPDGLSLVVGTEYGAALWNVETRRVRTVLPPSTPAVRAAAFSPGGRTVAMAQARGAALWDTSASVVRVVVDGQEGMAMSVAFAPDGRMVATASWGGVVRLWDAASGRLLAAYDWEVGRLDAVAFSPDGMRLAAGGTRGIVIWDADDALG